MQYSQSTIKQRIIKWSMPVSAQYYYSGIQIGYGLQNVKLL